jgi:hypothetical protein
LSFTTVVVTISGHFLSSDESMPMPGTRAAMHDRRSECVVHVRMKMHIHGHFIRIGGHVPPLLEGEPGARGWRY